MIIHTHDYIQKFHSFISDNSFHTIHNDPTTKYHNTIHKALQHCDRTVDKKQIKHLIQENTTPPTLNALLKLHKPNIPIRPVVNNRSAPSYKIAKKLNTILNHNLHLDNQYTATNSNTLANVVTKLKITPNHRLLTLDIKDLYVNIPISESLTSPKPNFWRIMMYNQIIMLLETILNQNYFSFQGQIYQPDKGVAMGSPTSGTMAEIFL